LDPERAEVLLRAIPAACRVVWPGERAAWRLHLFLLEVLIWATALETGAMDRGRAPSGMLGEAAASPFGVRARPLPGPSSVEVQSSQRWKEPV